MFMVSCFGPPGFVHAPKRPDRASAEPMRTQSPNLDPKSEGCAPDAPRHQSPAAHWNELGAEAEEAMEASIAILNAQYLRAACQKDSKNPHPVEMVASVPWYPVSESFFSGGGARSRARRFAGRAAARHVVQAARGAREQVRRIPPQHLPRRFR